MTADGGSVPEAPAVARLTRVQFWGCLAVALLIFAFVTGPVWTHPWDIDVLNVAIFISYIPIPFMVLACLAWRRALNLRGFFLDTLVVTLIKYSITFFFALCLWAVYPAPGAMPFARGARIHAVLAAEADPTPSALNPAEMGAISGVVSDAAGRPAAGVLVYIESGLERFVFPAPKAPLHLENGGSGVTPRVSVARLRQPIEARSTDGHLHTFIASAADGTALLNAPLLSSGVWSPVRLRESGFVATIHCSVHQRSGNEAPAYMAVLDHPFVATTDADGRFQWKGVPAGSLRVAAFHPDLGAGSVEARLEAGAATEAAIPLRKAASSGQ